MLCLLARATRQPRQITPACLRLDGMQIFRRKPMTEKIETELTALRERAEMLNNRHAAADAALNVAKSNLQRHHLEATSTLTTRSVRSWRRPLLPSR